jgi:hypothetical protein
VNVLKISSEKAFYVYLLNAHLLFIGVAKETVERSHVETLYVLKPK